MDAVCADDALAARVKECPGLADVKAGELRRADFDEAVAGSESADSFAALFKACPEVNRLLDAVFSASPFLSDLLIRDPARALRCLTEAPEARLEALGQSLRDLGAASMDEAMTALRRFRQELALLVGLCDISGAWTIDEVTAALSEGADMAVAAAIDVLLRQAAENGDFIPADPENPATDSGYIVLAMGKLGAGELNYSSDIDLIILYDAEAGRLREGLEPSKFYVRLTRNLVKLLQERTGDGYVFRVDLRLRPDPGATSAAISLGAALQYYESMGQNWERAALIKARAMAGDIAAGEDFLRELAPFIWRKYFDFAAIADVHAMKRQIHAYKGHGRIAVAGHNIKLGRGGIREIEFFVQTQQLIAGGRQPVLRERRTLDTLDRLVELEWIDSDARDELAEAYRFLRRVEHRLQMRNDEQVYILPEDQAELDAFAHFCALEGADDLASQLTARLRSVESHYAALFEDSPGLSDEAGNLVFTGGDDDPDTLQTLSRMGFSSPADVARVVRGWHFGRYAATRSEKARERLTELVPGLLKALSETANPQSAFIAFDNFLKQLPAGVQVFSMLCANEGLLSLLADIMGTAPRLASTLSGRASVLDAVLDPDFFGGLPSPEVLEEALDTALGLARTYEELLDRARRFGQEQAFLIGVRVLSGTISASQAGGAYAALAELLVGRLHREAETELGRAHGHVPGGAAVVLAMGKLGGHELTAASDLDLIVVYDFPEDAAGSDGERALAPSAYFTRLTQPLIAAISAPTGEGTLYEVDMRLRPSGNAGPVAASLASFASYQRDSAWTWEHMALTRARVISGDNELKKRVEAVIAETLCQKREKEKLAGEVVEMRRRIDEEKGSADPWQIKTVPGGLVDLEFIAQYLQLLHAAANPEILDTNTAAALHKINEAGLINAEAGEELIAACTLYHNLTQVLRVSLETQVDVAAMPRGLQLLLARAAALPDFSVLAAHLVETQGRVRRLFQDILGGAPWKERG